MVEKREIKDKRVIITDFVKKDSFEIIPKAIESCMKPGNFMVTPIEVTETEDKFIYQVGDQVVEVEKEQIEKGLIMIDEKSFTPEVFHKRGSCSSCTNCGGCSW